MTNPISTCLFNYFNWFQVIVDWEVGKLSVGKNSLRWKTVIKFQIGKHFVDCNWCWWHLGAGTGCWWQNGHYCHQYLLFFTNSFRLASVTNIDVAVSNSFAREVIVLNSVRSKISYISNIYRYMYHVFTVIHHKSTCITIFAILVQYFALYPVIISEQF